MIGRRRVDVNHVLRTASAPGGGYYRDVIRVLQLLTSTAPGGGPRQVLHLIRHLPADEFSVSAAGPSDQRFSADLQALGMKLGEVAVDSLRAFPMTLRAVERIVRDARADLVHTHGKGAGLYGRLAAWLCDVPSVHTFHGIHYERYPRAGQYLYLDARAMAGGCHAHGDQRVHDAAGRSAGPGCRAGRASTVVVNGIDVRELDARPKTERATLGLSDAHVVGCVARFDRVKQHAVLVDAVALVRERHPKVVLLLTGEGPEEARIVQRAEEKKVRVVISPGATAWKTNPYSSCDLYVTTSSKEGLPLAPLEAMASERAVIATKVPGNEDVVDHETTGLLVPPDGGAPALARAITALLDDPERRARMGQAGRARVLREFTIKSMVDKTAEVYRAAAASRAASRRS